MKLSKKQRSIISTVMGGVVAVCMAWQLVDWDTFEFDFRHIFPLFLSGMVAIGGHMTSLNKKDNTENP
jgi:hypothetical protein